MRLRTYQQDGIDAIKRDYDKQPLVSIATGGGKTLLIVKLAATVKGRCLIISHTEEIIWQIYKAMVEYGLQPGIIMGARVDFSSLVIVGTRQSVMNHLREIEEEGKIELLVIDEAHHATKDNTYGTIVRFFSPNKIVGFSATPERRDKNALFVNKVYSWTIYNGICDGFLVPFREVMVSLIGNSSAQPIMRHDFWLYYVFVLYKKLIYAKGRQCLAFFPSVKTSRLFVKHLQKRGIKAAHIDGKTGKKERKEILEDYQMGKLVLISNVSVLTEGFNAPNTSAILLARKLKSESLLTQILGRALRIHKDKKDCLFLNFGDKSLTSFIK